MTLPVSSFTNPRPNTCVDVTCSCKDIWSLSQQFAMKQIVESPEASHEPDAKAEKKRFQFMADPILRARRIAAAYARVYLEDFPHGDENQIGRFYWLGLGAFAAKEIAVILNEWQVKALYIAPHHGSAVYDGLERGNLWLYNDVLPWFYGYAFGSDTFDMCMTVRNGDHLVDPVRDNLKLQKDYGKAIKIVPWECDGETGARHGSPKGYFQWTGLVKKSFDSVKMCETLKGKARFGPALDSLLAMTQHEQGEILQPLMYDDPDFQYWAQVQRNRSQTPVIRKAIPDIELVMTPEDDTDDPRFKEVAPVGLIVENYQERMNKLIKKTINKYNWLMQNFPGKMHDYLAYIANWSSIEEPTIMEEAVSAGALMPVAGE